MTDQPPLSDALADARSVLVLGGDDTVCGALLARRPPADTAALAVSYRRSGAAWLDHARSALGGAPAEALVVDAGGTTESDAVAAVAPDDPTGIQIALAEAFPLDAAGVFCFDSLTALLQYLSVEDAYRFLNELLGQLWAAGVAVHAHLDPAAHETTTVRALASLFDAVVAPDSEAVPAPTRPATARGVKVAVAVRERSGAEGND